MPLVTFPTEASFQENNYQGLPVLLKALHVYGAKPPHFHAEPKRAAEMGVAAQQQGSQTLLAPFAWPLKARA